MQPLLEIKNLSVDFVKEKTIHHAVENISFTVGKGETVALAGESGSGKSVSALSILHLLQKNAAKIKSGEIFFTENNITTNLLTCTKKQLQTIRGNKIAMIFQEPMTSLNPVLACGAQVAEALRAHRNISAKKAKEKTITLFTETELPNPQQLFYKYPHQLSGGQKQRVMIAMAMCCDPQLLICDEPTTALDVLVQKNILLLLKKLQQQNNMSMIFISHDLNVVKNIADKIVVLYKGRIAEENSSANIFSNPQHAYTKALLACRPALHDKDERLPVVSDFFVEEEGVKRIENGEWRIENNDKNFTASFQKENIQQSIINDQYSANIKHPTSNIEHQTSNFQHSTINNQQPTTLLSLQNLCIYFPVKTNFFGKTFLYNKAVDDVSFNIETGETIGLVGGSGCGKTTLGRAAAALIKPTSGKIFFNQKNISLLTKKELTAFHTKVQIIFQDPYSSLNPRKKIGDAIAEPMLVHHLYSNEKQCRQKVIELLEKVNLSPLYYARYPHELSGGQRQRAVIARALALNPSFIICDECISALDVSVQAQVLNLLNDLKKEFSFTILFISHDLAAVHYLCDKIIVMNKGKIEEQGSAAQIWNSPQSIYTKRLLDAVEVL